MNSVPNLATTRAEIEASHHKCSPRAELLVDEGCIDLMREARCAKKADKG